jgi:hypothetical protein
MIKFFFFTFFISLSVFADQTCETRDYIFRITDSYIEASGRGVEIKVPYHQMRSLSQNSRGDFKSLIKRLSESAVNDEALTLEEASQIYRFSITVADDVEELVTLKYIKAYAESGMIVARFMLSQDTVYRCY